MKKNAGQEQPPDPVRVMIVVDIARCAVGRAEETIRVLDRHDQEQQAKQRKAGAGNQGGRYANLYDTLKGCTAALVGSGYSQKAAENILQTVFSSLALSHGGKRLYIGKQQPKAGRP